MSYLKWNDKSMTIQETALIRGIQKEIGAEQDGYFGPHTLASFFRKYNSKHRFSLVVNKNLLIFSNSFRPKLTLNKSGLKAEQYAISGTFQWQNKTSSMLCIDGEWIRKSSTHDWLKQPETVLYITKSGKVGCQRVLYWSEIKEDVLHAVGGMGLHNWNIELEGFVAPYGDVHRRTGHTAIGYDGLGFIGVYFPNATSQEIKKFMLEDMRCEFAILLDGGHIAAASTPDGVKNGTQVQNNIITF